MDQPKTYIYTHDVISHMMRENITGSKDVCADQCFVPKAIRFWFWSPKRYGGIYYYMYKYSSLFCWFCITYIHMKKGFVCLLDSNCGFRFCPFFLSTASVPVGGPKEATSPGYRINDITSEQLVSDLTLLNI